MKRIITALAVAVAVTASLLVGSPAQASTYTRTGNCSWLPLVGKTITVTYERNDSTGHRRPRTVKFAGGTVKVKIITADWVYNNGTLMNRETASYGTGVTSATVTYSPAAAWLNPAFNNYVAVKLTAAGGQTCRVNVGD